MVNTPLILGTAQMGSAYGIANRVGELDGEESRNLIKSALTAGISRFDTAAAYGRSERLLGSSLTELEAISSVQISTKGSITGIDATMLASVIDTSLHALKIERLEHWLLHNENEINLWSSTFDEASVNIKNEGTVRSFGVSVYHVESAVTALQKRCFESIQCPASPFDRRFLRCGFLRDMATNGKQIMLRSVYLQGLCLMNPVDVPSGIERGAEAVRALDEFCKRHSVKRDYFCLQYVLHRGKGLSSGVVIGLETPEQLHRNVSIAQSKPLPAEIFDEWDRVWPDDVARLILPLHWKLHNI